MRSKKPRLAPSPASRCVTKDKCGIKESYWIQVEYLLGVAAVASGGSAKVAVLGVTPVSLCGNGVCETGERPVANTSSSIGSTGVLQALPCFCLNLKHRMLRAISDFLSCHDASKLCLLLIMGNRHVPRQQAADQEHNKIVAWVASVELASPLCAQHAKLSCMLCLIMRSSSCEIACVTAGCPADCPVPFVPCPKPPGSLSPCTGAPRGVCASASGACACGRGYAGADCGGCSSGFYRQGTRCLAKPNSAPTIMIASRYC